MSHTYSKSDSSLVGCYAVVESNTDIATGKISYVEGEIFEVEFPQYKNFQSGDSIKVVIYSTEGTQRFTTTLVAKDTGSVILLTPPSILAAFIKKRKHPRVDIEVKGLIYTSDPLEIYINNMGLGGIGFFAPDMEIREEEIVFAKIKFEVPFFCAMKILHKKQTEQRLYYGAKFHELKKEQINSLRAFILKQQIECYYDNKKNNICIS